MNFGIPSRASRLRARSDLSRAWFKSKLLRSAHFRPHRLWLALLATRLSRELVESLIGLLQRAGEFNKRTVQGKRAAKAFWLFPVRVASEFLRRGR